jgi:hypothetical protein
MKKSKKELFVDVAIGVTLGVVLVGVLFFNEALFSFFNNHSKPKNKTTIVEENKIPSTLFGYNIDNHFFEKDIIKNNQILGSILYWEGVRFSVIDELARKSKEVFDVRMIRSKKKITLVRRDSCGALQSLIYEPNNMSYVIYNVADSVFVKKVIRPVETKVEFASGIVTSSLWNSMKDNNLNISLIDKMEDALSSEVDFYHAQKGDKYKLLFAKIPFER